MDNSELQNRATEIIMPLIPPDAEKRAARALKQWNQIVRDHIRAETGLKLSEGDSRFAIPVRIAPDFPASLAGLINHYSDTIVWRLIVGQPKLGGLIEGLAFLLEDWEQFERWAYLPAVAKDGQSVLHKCSEIAWSLQEVALTEEVRKKIKAIHEDILGVYKFPLGVGPSVELYWLPIAMVAGMLDVSIEDLTAVVLIHELAHGYTHLGRDIDGTRWEDIAFQKSAKEVVEGLAQFYTEAISERLASRTPTVQIAYKSLLGLQSGPYLVHQDWLQGSTKRKGETIRFALIAARTKGRIDYNSWQQLMEETHGKL